MSKPVILIGGGDHAFVLLQTLLLLDIEILAVCSKDQPRKEFSPYQWLKSNEQLLEYKADSVELVNGVGFLDSHNPRKSVYDYFHGQGFRFRSLVHPTVILPKDTEIGEGSQIMAGCVIQPGFVLGVNSLVNTGGVVDHDVKVGSHCHLAPGVVICGGVHIGNSTFVGAGSTIIQHRRIGSTVLIAAGSMVYSHVGDGEQLIQKRQRTS